MQQVMPAFEVDKLDGTIEHKTYQYVVTYLRDEDGDFVKDEDGRKIIQTKQRVEKIEHKDAGWMIYFPRGHSIRITDPAEMKRLGFDRAPGLVDLQSESEDDGLPQSTPSLKQRHNRRAGRARPATGSKEAGVNET